MRQVAALVVWVVAVWVGQATGETIYVNPVTGADTNSGLRDDAPVKTLARAMKLLKPGSTLSLGKIEGPYRERLSITVSGEAGRPVVIEGNGATIDLGTNVSAGPWKQDGAEWVLEREYKKPKREGTNQLAIAYVNNAPIVVKHPKAPGALRPGEARFAEDRLRIVFPAGIEPGKCRVMLPADPSISGVAISSRSHIVVRNLTVRYAGNDGFNIHGHCRGIRFENVRAFYCGDEGISAHETAEVDVDGAELAYNGSSSGGVADINESVTTYRNCLVHHNLRGAPFFLVGKRHVVSNSVYFDNGKPDPVNSGQTQMTITNCLRLPVEGQAVPESLRGLVKRAEKIRKLPGDAEYMGEE